MSAPVLLAIVLNMQTALQAISVGSGYFNTVKPTSVVLDDVELLTIPSTETPYFIVGHLVEPVARNFETTKPTGILEKWRVTVDARIDAPGTGTARKLTALTQLEADVEKALCVDLQRGGLAQYTYTGQATCYTNFAQQNIAMLRIPVEILLRREYGVP